MQKQNVEQIIRDLATANFNLYPEDYEIKDGLSTDEATTNAQELANSYWDQREEAEIERDENLDIIKTDYQDWVMSAYESYVQQVIAVPPFNRTKAVTNPQGIKQSLYHLFTIWN